MRVRVVAGIVLCMLSSTWKVASTQEPGVQERELQARVASAVLEHALSQVSAEDPRFPSVLRSAIRELEEIGHEELSQTDVRGLRASLRRGEPSDTHELEIDRDPDYRRNLLALFQAAAAAETDSGGRVDVRVIGGKATSEFRDTVAVEKAFFTGELCTGVLIGSRAVLTAAHCHCLDINDVVHFGPRRDTLLDRHLVVKAAGNGLQPPQMPPGLRCPPNRSRAAIQARTVGHDLAVYWLKDPVPPERAEPRRIATRQLWRNVQVVRAAGFGLDENETAGVKRYVDIPIVSVSCERTLGGRPDSLEYKCVRGKELVAASKDFSRATCNGDSGGPIYIWDELGRHYLVGVTSRGIKGDCRKGGIYTLITGEVVKWLRGLGIGIEVGRP